MKMRIKDAVLKSLEELNKISNSTEICDHIIKNSYCDFTKAQTPDRTISACLGDFIRNGDSRVKRIKPNGKYYMYYLVKDGNADLDNDVQNLLEIRLVDSDVNKNDNKRSTGNKISFSERDLHLLLSSYLKGNNIYSKTIFHEKSTGKDPNQKWTHPDLVGVSFLKLKQKTSQNFLKAINKVDTFEITSYEVKKEIISDSELKKCFFQAVSNSSWANYGYLVAFEISGNLYDEIERLSQSFGIGVIELKANPFESKILFPSQKKNLDFKTIDKLCGYSQEFDHFIEQIEKVMTANEKYIKASEKELSEFCDKFLKNDSEMIAYCQEKNIPVDVPEEIE